MLDRSFLFTLNRRRSQNCCCSHRGGGVAYSEDDFDGEGVEGVVDRDHLAARQPELVHVDHREVAAPQAHENRVRSGERERWRKSEEWSED
eukprot:2526213-Rhodomonas_salina.1